MCQIPPISSHIIPTLQLQRPRGPLKPRLHDLPVQNVQHRVHIRSLVRIVLQIKRMFPLSHKSAIHPQPARKRSTNHIHAHHSLLLARKRSHRILILCSSQLQPPLLILYQPSPPAPLDPEQHRLQLALKPVDGSEALAEGFGEAGGRGGIRLRRGGRAEGRPEEGVVDVSAAVEFAGWC